MKKALIIVLFLAGAKMRYAVGDQDGPARLRSPQRVPAANSKASYLAVGDQDGLVPAANSKASYLAQNIFDDDALEKPEVKPVTKPVPPVSGNVDKIAAKPNNKKRRKVTRKKKKAAVKEAGSGASYSPEEIARASYSWAPETEPMTLLTMATGMKGQPQKESIKHQAVAMAPETIEGKSAPQGSSGFKLPQIPLAQVLIVAGFVILFLIYRFRVGRQIKRKRY